MRHTSSFEDRHGFRKMVTLGTFFIDLNILDKLMGLFKNTLKVANEIVTLGGAGRLEAAKQAYQNTYDGYLVLYKEAEGFKAEIEENVKAIGDALAMAKTHLEKSAKLIKRSVHCKIGLNLEIGTQTLGKVDRFNSEYMSAIAIGAGSLGGGSLAVGSWVIVSALGSASTGVAISGLTGVAATNATLAWFGGGALAAGGAGMAGGVAMLGGIVAIPLVVFAAKGAHKKARDIEEAKIDLDKTIIQIREQLATLPGILNLIRKKERETAKRCVSFISEIGKLSGEIRPNGMFSAAKQQLFILFGMDPYTKEQTAAIERLALAITNFLDTFGISEEEQSKIKPNIKSRIPRPSA